MAEKMQYFSRIGECSSYQTAGPTAAGVQKVLSHRGQQQIVGINLWRTSRVMQTDNVRKEVSCQMLHARLCKGAAVSRPCPVGAGLSNPPSHPALRLHAYAADSRQHLPSCSRNRAARPTLGAPPAHHESEGRMTWAEAGWQAHPAALAASVPIWAPQPTCKLVYEA